MYPVIHGAGILLYWFLYKRIIGIIIRNYDIKCFNKILIYNIKLRF